MPVIFTTHHENGHGIRNRAGTAGANCGCKGWLRHWKLVTGSSGKLTCSVENCKGLGLVGAHVNLVEDPNGKTYIAPMCPRHNGKHGEEFKSKPGIKLAWANKQETCGS